jgi:hypothetical protein
MQHNSRHFAFVACLVNHLVLVGSLSDAANYSQREERFSQGTLLVLLAAMTALGAVVVAAV